MTRTDWTDSDCNSRTDQACAGVRGQVESRSFFFPLRPGCDGGPDCAAQCPYDALHVIRGPLLPPAPARPPAPAQPVPPGNPAPPTAIRL